MITYVCGFRFDLKMNGILLQEKAQPDWQRGKLNGIGGKIEIGETSLEAMQREYSEETNSVVKEWIPFVTLGDNKGRWRVDFFKSFGPISFMQHPTEKLIILVIDKVPYVHSVEHLNWLIPLALQQTKGISQVIMWS